jgi:hypothetical protein
MRKLELRVEDLAVETFDAGSDAGIRGTVHGNNTFFPQTNCCPSGPQQTNCCDFTYNPADTQCVSYAEPCEESRVPHNCFPSNPTDYVCNSCRDSITAC